MIIFGSDHTTLPCLLDSGQPGAHIRLVLLVEVAEEEGTSQPLAL